MCKLNIAVGSKNPVKSSAVKNGAQKTYPKHEINISGYNVPSGVSKQPLDDLETKHGAVNRARGAFAAFKAEHQFVPNYAVGLEGGVIVNENSDMECFAYIAVYDGSKVSTSRTSAFLLPHAVKHLILHEQLELGEADDRVFNRQNSKQQDGAIGILTNGLIDRTQYYEQAVILAFIPFQWKDMYDIPQATPAIDYDMMLYA